MTGVSLVKITKKENLSDDDCYYYSLDKAKLYYFNDCGSYGDWSFLDFI